MAALSHDGHAVICAYCRNPIRASVMTTAPLAFVEGEVSVGDVAGEFVECDNCGAGLGTVEAVREEYAQAVGV